MGYSGIHTSESNGTIHLNRRGRVAVGGLPTGSTIPWGNMITETERQLIKDNVENVSFVNDDGKVYLEVGIREDGVEKL